MKCFFIVEGDDSYVTARLQTYDRDHRNDEILVKTQNRRLVFLKAPKQKKTLFARIFGK